MIKSYMTQEQRQEIRILCKQGLPYKEIALKFNLSPSSICRIATEGGIYRINSKGAWRHARRIRNETKTYNSVIIDNL